MEIFRRFRDVGVTIVVATHDLALVRESGARQIVLDAGRVAEAGAPSPAPELPSMEARR
jgi:cell division transport system ATP-binding protein